MFSTSRKLVHNSTVSPCSYIYVVPPVYFSSLVESYCKYNFMWLMNMLAPYAYMYITDERVGCNSCVFYSVAVPFLPVNTLLEHSKISLGAAVMWESLSLAFISAAALSSEISTAALSCQLPQERSPLAMSTWRSMVLLSLNSNPNQTQWTTTK